MEVTDLYTSQHYLEKPAVSLRAYSARLWGQPPPSGGFTSCVRGQ